MGIFIEGNFRGLEIASGLMHAMSHVKSIDSPPEKLIINAVECVLILTQLSDRTIR
jgi:hypothetical protein